MVSYIIRRLLLLPLTLFCIVLVNFIIINLAPGDPTSVTEISADGGAMRKEDKSVAFGSDERYLQFREHYGLTLPILFNTWPSISEEEVREDLLKIHTKKEYPGATQEMSVKDLDALKVSFGDRARFVMPLLLKVADDGQVEDPIRRLAVRFFIRGGTKQGILGSGLTAEEKKTNRVIAASNFFLNQNAVLVDDSKEVLEEKVKALKGWYGKALKEEVYEPDFPQKVRMFFFETRFWRYMSRVFQLDFGTLRNDPNRKVIVEVVSRFKYSLTLAILPMLMTFVLCQVFGFYMAQRRGQWQDLALNVMFLILYAIPVFVVAPFLIEKVALNNTFPFTDQPIPIAGFTSPEKIYMKYTSWERLWDVLQHIALPLVAIMYGGLASDARLARTAVLEVLRQDYVRTAKAKGLSNFKILFKHVGRNAAITIVTSIAGSLGIVLGGSLIIETIFGIDGFGHFFYEAVVNRDYNVIMFSVFSGAFLSLLGYLLADITYTLLDPRVTLD